MTCRRKAFPEWNAEPVQSDFPAHGLTAVHEEPAPVRNSETGYNTAAGIPPRFFLQALSISTKAPIRVRSCSASVSV